jgi:integration host factor subunit beta
VIKSELVRRISAQKPQLYEREVERVVNTMLDEIATALACGDRVELRGFGVFAVKVRQPHIGRNPRTQTTFSVPEKALPFFKPGKPMRERLNPMSIGQDFDADPESASYPASLL